MDDPSGSGSSDLSLQDLMGEHSARPSVAPRIWCIEYVAKFKKDLHAILAMMNIGFERPVDLGKRTNEVVALRILEFMFNPSKKNGDGISDASASGPRIEFDLSLSSMDVLKAILKEIPLAELRPGMSELSKFNVLPFIAHKNSCLPRCALERLRDVVLEENQTNAAPSIQACETVLRDEQPMHMEEQLKQGGEEAMHIDRETMRMKDVENQRNAASFIDATEPVLRDEQTRHIGEKPMHMVEEAVHINEQAKAIIISDDEPMDISEQAKAIIISDDEQMDINEQAKAIIIGDDEQMDINEQAKAIIIGDDEPMDINEQAKVVAIGDDCENDGVQEEIFEWTNNGNTDSSYGRRQDVRVRCGKDGTWLICSNKDVSATVPRECVNSLISPDGDRSNTSKYPPSSSRTRQDIVCVKCGKGGTLLICSSWNCSAKVHLECLNSPVSPDENENFRCPECRYHQVTSEYLEAKTSLQAAKKNLVRFLGKVSPVIKRLRDDH